MRFHVRFKNVSEESHDRIEQDIRKAAERELGARLKTFREDLVRLYATVERSNHHEHLYRIGLRLELPRKVLVAREQDYDLELAISAAVTDLGRQLERYLHRLRGEDLWRRNGRRQALRRLKAHLGGLPAAERTDYIRGIKQYAGRLQRVIQRELSYLRAEGSLSPDYPEVQDVLDEVLVRAQRNLPDRPPGMDDWHWLLNRMVQVLAEEVRSYQSTAGALVLERGLRSIPDDVSEDMVQEEIWEFYQPDAALRLEDVLPDEQTDDPETIVERRQRAHLMFRLLSYLPVDWRRAVELVQIEGLDLDEAAALLEASPADVQSWLEMADFYLRAKLADAGVAPPESDTAEPAIQALLARTPAAETEDEAELRQELEALA